MKSITIGQEIFKSKKAATERIRTILYRYPLDVEIFGEDAEFLRNLVMLHTRALEKRLHEAKSFLVRDDGYKKRCFWIKRHDGTESDFSFDNCLNGESLESLVLPAMRTEIRPQIVAFRDHALMSVCRCPFTNDILSVDNSHVDHQAPETFLKLACDWLKANNFTWRDIVVSAGQDASTSRQMTDPEQASSWGQYHQRFCKLRLLSKRGNLSHAKYE